MKKVINVTAGQANSVKAKNGDWFSPTGYVQITESGYIEACLDHASTILVLGDQELFEAACDSLCRCAVGIVNLTQHDATPDQRDAGVVAVETYSNHVKELLTFDEIPSPIEMGRRAIKLAEYAYESGCKKAMIGGAPFFMSTLEKALIDQGITPVYSFSQRVSVENTNADGSVSKSNVFKHLGFVG